MVALSSFSFASVALTSFFLVLVAAQVKSVTELFNIDFSTDDNGGCNYIGEARMQQLINEVYQISYASMQLLTAFESTDQATATLQAQRLLGAFFDGQHITVSERKAIRSRWRLCAHCDNHEHVIFVS